MQILPISQSNSNSDIFAGMSEQDNGDAFAAAMQQALTEVENGEEISVESAMGDDTPKVESPYSRNTADGVTYTLDEVCFTKQELADLRAELVREGAPAEALKQFDILADQPDGATLAQVMASLAGCQKSFDLSDDDIHAITALLNKIDPTGDLSANTLQLMSDGKGLEALQLISDTFADLDTGDAIEIGQDEILALGRGLGLNQNALDNLAANFAGQDNIKLMASQFEELMAPAQSQLLDEKINRQKLDTALNKTINTLVAKARKRMESEKAATALKTKKADQNKAMIGNRVKKASNDTLSETLNAAQKQIEETQTALHSDAVSRKLNGEQSGMVGGAGDEAVAKQPARTPRQVEVPAPKAQPRNENNSVQQETTTSLASQIDGETWTHRQMDSQEFTFQGNQEKKKDSAWNGLLEKVEAKASTAAKPTTSSIVYSVLQASQQDESATMQAEQISSGQLEHHVVDQVQQGMVTALKGGGTRLDLQLHPQELGAITITLTARNGEVSAKLITDKTETAELVHRQIESIRINLEQQGIKVDKIEVQLQGQENENSQQWADNLDQHNSWQEEDARREELARLKNLASIRNNTRNMENEYLEQPVQYTLHPARYASQSLHLVA